MNIRNPWILSKLSLYLLTIIGLLSSVPVFALGLGVLEVKSNLDEPLNGRIELIVAPGDDISSVNASIAGREDFERLGIDYPEYLQNLSLNLESDGEGTFSLRIGSGEVVIKQPFIHFLVKVDFAGGSFLREYTALIDPPVYAASTPRGVSEPIVAGVDQTNSPDIATQDQEIDSAAPTNTSEADPINTPTDARYGPVARGENLSTIAEELSSQFADLSMYQIMQVMFEENPDAFINNNINGLKEGAVLRISDLNRVREKNNVAAIEFYSAQSRSWDPSLFASVANQQGVRLGQEEQVVGAVDDTRSDSSATTSAVASFQVGASTETNEVVSSGQGDVNRGEVLALQQQVFQLESSLASSQLENQELTERISLLESQLADVNRLLSLDVEDAEMAAVQAALASQNSQQAGDESASSEEKADQAKTGFIDPADIVQGTDVESGKEDVRSVLSVVPDEVPAEDGSALTETIDESTSVSGNSVSNTTNQTTTSSSPGFFAGLRSQFQEQRLWPILAGIGAVLLGGLVLFYVRRRRADKEFEVSMMSTASQAELEEAEEQDSIDDDSKRNVGDSSFLTDYSDSDAVVKIDEIDPVAEADVYIAYGRDEQAAEALLAGIAKNPSRVDIKQKLLALYHKNNNVEGFERVAEELYSQKDFVDKSVWQEVALMGQDLAPENPLFEMASQDAQSETERIVTGGDRVDATAEDSESIDITYFEGNDAIDETAGNETIDISDPGEIDGDHAATSDTDEVDNIDTAQVDVEESDALFEEFDNTDAEPLLVSEINGSEIDADYDEYRTQFELAKVFIDLGDEDGARKILNELVANDDPDPELIKDANQLLDSIKS